MSSTLNVLTDNRAIARRYVEKFLAQNDGSVADEVLDPNFIYYTEITLDGKPIKGPEATKQAIDNIHQSFPDINLKIEDIFAGEDRVVVRFKVTATHSQTMLGVPPSGKKITFIETHVFRFHNSKIVEDYVSVNNYKLTFLFDPAFQEQW
jgi:steroid delta-isomerase-like uncharacterized protein